MNVELPARTPNGRARAEALAARPTVAAQTALVPFHSDGSLLIIGPVAEARPLAERLHGDLRCVILSSEGAGEDGAAIPVIAARVEEVRGHMGQFEARARVQDRSFNPAQLLPTDRQTFDLVLDLQSTPAIDRDLPPLGYYAPRGDTAQLARAMHELPDLVGDFDKPRFFHYDADICAHGRNGLRGCQRCIETCPTEAIRSLGERVEIDPYLCQGGGSCATACPSGAIRYRYPSPEQLLDLVKTALQRYREAQGRNPCVLFYDREGGADALSAIAEQLPESVLPFEVEEIGSLGLEVWLASLAYGASHVLLYSTHSVPRSVMREISLQLCYAASILEGMGHSRERLQLLLEADGADYPTEVICSLGGEESLPPAGFAPFPEKRLTARLAIEHLRDHAPAPKSMAVLPVGAPFGTIQVDAERCTLCMACAGVCPGKALYDGDEQPQLRFVEANCLQCGLCHVACPEDAIRLQPRMVYDDELFRSMRVLHEEPPFCCVSCGKPFATQKLMQRMTEKLRGHWMFQKPEALRRIQMCEDCRVRDMFETGGMEQTFKPPGDRGGH